MQNLEKDAVVAIRTISHFVYAQKTLIYLNQINPLNYVLTAWSKHFVEEIIPSIMASAAYNYSTEVSLSNAMNTNIDSFN